MCRIGERAETANHYANSKFTIIILTHGDSFMGNLRANFEWFELVTTAMHRFLSAKWFIWKLNCQLDWVRWMFVNKLVEWIIQESQVFRTFNFSIIFRVVRGANRIRSQYFAFNTKSEVNQVTDFQAVFDLIPPFRSPRLLLARWSDPSTINNCVFESSLFSVYTQLLHIRWCM